MLESLGLRGEFPSQTLGNLSALAHLSVFNNSLSGALPPELWRLSQLSYLSVSRNDFSGNVPADISVLLKLSRLDLSHNRFSGPLPPQLGWLPSLRFLYLSSNSLSSPLPRFSISSLVFLDLSSNNFSEAFPASKLSALSYLRDLNVSHNHLDGPLNNSLSSLPSLSSLDLSGNNLSGYLPSLQELRFLTLLDLSDNEFEGDVSVFVGGLPASLYALDLSSNKLTGDPPSWNISGLSALVRLDLAGNDLASSSCEWVDGFKHLEFVNLSRSHVVGIIPPSIGRLNNLTEVDLSLNQLKGTVPSTFASLRVLTYLDLSSNNLSGDLAVLTSVPSLHYLNLSYNEGTGCAPPALVSKFGPDSFKGLCEPSAVVIIQNKVKRHPSVSKTRLAIILASTGGSILVICAFVATGLFCRKKAELVSRKFPAEEKYVSGPFSFETDSGMWLANVKNPSSVAVSILEKPLLNLTFADLLQATSNFGKESQLTEGGFGPVYRAILPSGLDVTIKVLIEGRILTDHEAAVEFCELSKIKHPNLVPLLGYCIVGDERLVIYEYMENGGLHRWLHELPIGAQLDDWSRDLWEPVEVDVPASGELVAWSRRHSIALGIARALAFLHHGQSPPLVHRDVKASNVMLNAEFEPRLANTGLVGLLAASDEGLFAGSTPGYAPPEYRQPGGKVSPRGDVYSFGVVLLELITGKMPVGDSYQDGYTGNLVGWVRSLMKEKRAHRALDARISSRGAISEMLEALRIGYLCTADSPSKRPTMQQIVGLLKDLEPHGCSP